MVALAVVVLSLPLLSTRLPASAQPAGKVYQIGLLGTREGPNTPAFRQGLRDFGYSEGRSITIMYRWSEGSADRFPALAAELVRLKMDVIVASGSPAALAAKAATTTIPIVFTLVGDPVALGLVSSLAHPSGNITGFASVVPEGFTQKQLELLKEMVPRATRVAVLVDPSMPRSYDYGLPATAAAADKLKLRLQILEARSVQEIERAFEAAAEARADAMHVYGQPLFFLNRARIVELAASRRLPVMFFSDEVVKAGGLMSFGPNLNDILRRTAGHVDKILKGARPSDLPVEQPTKYDLVINAKTARALGLTVPPSLLLRADRIVE